MEIKYDICTPKNQLIIKSQFIESNEFHKISKEKVKL